MTRILLSGGTALHAVASSWSLWNASAQAEMGSWLLAGVLALVPSVFGLAAVVLTSLISRSPEVLTLDL